MNRPDDHDSFLAVRAEGFKALRKALAKRRKPWPDPNGAPHLPRNQVRTARNTSKGWVK